VGLLAEFTGTGLPGRDVAAYIAAQAAGGVLGAVLILALFPAARLGTGGGPALADRVTSAGSEPAGQVNPAVAAAMAEIGVDISREVPKPLGAGQAEAADMVISMGCGDTCPAFPGKRYLAWELPDPAGLTVEQVRPIPDDIAGRVRALLAELGVPAGG